jgi:DNA-directed RNA polymerase specialized sigma24 family protein
VKIFDWRGARFPEECADETINRVARKLASGETIRDVPTYCQGVARLVFLETLKKHENRQVSIEELQSMAMEQSESDEDIARRQCFEKCLSDLPSENRQLILQYYEDETRAKINNRQAMANSLNIPLNALRSRAQRIRDKLETCCTKCLMSTLQSKKF